jgi:hypothetical protein
MGRGRHRWLVRVYLGRDHKTCKRRYHSRMVHGPVRHAQTYLNKVLREHDLGRQVDGAQITLNEYLDRWLTTAAKPRLREKSYRSYESLLRRYVRPSLGARNLAAICPLDIQAAYQELVERGLSARTVRYTHSVLRSAMRQAIRWRLLAEDPTNGAQRRDPRVSGEFLLHYLDALVYPDIPPLLLTLCAIAVCLFNLGIYPADALKAGNCERNRTV